jgi:hypothetical protein
MSKLMPGPWFVGNVNERCHEVDNVEGWPVAEVFGAANAQLIAAAPDLLDALKGVVRVADRATVEFDAARAAIIKAEGWS